MAEIKVTPKNKSAEQWDEVLFASSSDIVKRFNKPGETVETSLTALESAVATKAPGTVKTYSALTEINSAFTMATTMEEICAAMANSSIALYSNTTGTTSAIYPTANGTVLIVKSGAEYCFALYNDVTTNSMYTGIFAQSKSRCDAGLLAWTGWRSYEVTFDDTVTESSANGVKSSGIYAALLGKVGVIDQDTQPADDAQNTNDFWLKPI